jgi:hypothetical protein
VNTLGSASDAHRVVDHFNTEVIEQLVPSLELRPDDHRPYGDDPSARTVEILADLAGSTSLRAG